MSEFIIEDIVTTEDVAHRNRNLYITIREELNTGEMMKHHFTFTVHHDWLRDGRQILRIEPDKKTINGLGKFKYDFQCGVQGAVDIKYIYDAIMDRFKRDLLDYVKIKIGTDLIADIDMLVGL